MARKKKSKKIKVGARGKKNRSQRRANRTLSKMHREAKRLLEALESVNDINDNREVRKVLRNYNVRISDTVKKKIKTLRDFNVQGKKAHEFVNRYVKKGWNRNKARNLYYLVTDDIYNQFRQKYNIPSDVYYQLISEDFDENDILMAMNKMNEMDDINLQDISKEDIYNMLKDLIL